MSGYAKELVQFQRRARREERRRRSLESSNAVLRTPELLQLIFIHCRILYRNSGGRPHPNRAPLNLAHVCRYWRDVAHGTPFIWSTIHLTGKDLSRTQYQRHRELLQLWLRYSGSAPLTVRLSYTIDHFRVKRTLGVVLMSDAKLKRAIEDMYLCTTEVLKLVAFHADRWKCLSITAPAQILSAVEGIVGPQTSLLEACELYGHSELGYTLPASTSSLTLDFSFCTRLRKVDICVSSEVILTLPPCLEALRVVCDSVTLHTSSALDNVLRRLCIIPQRRFFDLDDLRATLIQTYPKLKLKDLYGSLRGHIKRILQCALPILM